MAGTARRSKHRDVQSASLTLTWTLSGREPASCVVMERHLGRYELRGLLGEGGMGTVYEAYDPLLERAVAIKVLRRDSLRRDELAARLLREAVAMGRLNHPNVIRVYDAGVDAGQSFVAMELVRGGTLAAWLTAAPRSIRAVIGAFAHAGLGLAAAHDAGLVHRDFKPENVLVDHDGRVLVTDFGLARSVSDPRPDIVVPAGTPTPFVTAAGEVVGTPEFMAPEQSLGCPVDARADQYSFCLALWHALPATARLPGGIRAALLRGLATNPERRFASMHELLAVLAPSTPRVRTSRRSARVTSSCSVATRPGRLRPPS